MCGLNANVNLNTGGWNVAVGDQALLYHGTGNYNSGVGSSALLNLNDGNENNALGYQALYGDTSGSGNVAVGNQSMYANQTGALNTAIGTRSLRFSTAGQQNVAIGGGALYNLNGGSNNIAVGYEAGKYLSTGSNNIHVGNSGDAADSSVIRIGSAQTSTFIAGVYGITASSGAAVYINSNGQLGTSPSSRRFKQDVRDMGDTSGVLMGLRPVRFHYKADGPEGPEQYGLIAEEVEEIAPDLVGRGQDGQIDFVHYEKVDAMLLNEVQKQHRTIEAQSDLIRQLESRLAALEATKK